MAEDEKVFGGVEVKRKIAFLSNSGDAADLGLRMALEDGVQVKLWIKEAAYKSNFDGVLDKTLTWQEAVRWSDFVVFDDGEMPEIWEQVHKYKPCFGGSSFSAKLEHDRRFGHQIMKRIGLKTIESVSYKSGREVINHIKSHDDTLHVVKPTGKEIESHEVLIGKDKDQEDVISQVERLMDLKVLVDSWEVEQKGVGS